MSSPVAGAQQWWRRALRGAVLFALVLLVTAFLVRLAMGYWTARQLHAELARIKSAGEPVTLKELRLRLPAIDEADDAWPYYEAALALVRQRDLDETERESRASLRGTAASRMPAPTKHLDAAERTLADNGLMLGMLSRGTHLPACRGTIWIEQGWDLCADRFRRTLAAVKLSALQAHVCLARGDGDAAVESLIGALKLLRVLDTQPVFLAAALRAAAMELVGEYTQFVLQFCQPSDAALRTLQEALLEADAALQLTRVALAERVYGIESMQNLIVAGVGVEAPLTSPSPVPPVWPRMSWWTRPWVEYRAVQYLRGMSEFVGAARKPWAQALEAIRSLRVESSPGTGVRGSPWMHAVQRLARAVAVTRAAATAVMIERCRRGNGALPASLDGLLPAYAESLPIDPFTGRELLYRPAAGGYTVYSVGPNGADDQGEVDRDETKRPRDAGIRIRRRLTE